MKKTDATMRQINTVREELDKKIREAHKAWLKKHSRPLWKTEEAWERAHKSPQRMHKDAENQAMKALFEKRDKIIFDARMGKLSADELYVDTRKF